MKKIHHSLAAKAALDARDGAEREAAITLAALIDILDAIDLGDEAAITEARRRGMVAIILAGFACASRGAAHNAERRLDDARAEIGTATPKGTGL